MRIVLADLKGGDGFISKDTVAGGYGSRLRPFSKVTRLVAGVKRRFHDLPSVHLAYVAALASRAGHEVVASRGELVDGDVAIVLSSLVDYRRETAWARAMRARGARVGFIGLAAQKLPQLFQDDADFIVDGEPEAAVLRLVSGHTLSGAKRARSSKISISCRFRCGSRSSASGARLRVPFAGRPVSGSLPLLASRSCPEFCTYCPHRIQSTYRSRSVSNMLDELGTSQDTRGPLHIVFRDPLFSQERDRVLELCDGIRAAGCAHTFECETRLDRLDDDLLVTMHGAGLRAMSFGVEAVADSTLKKVGRRPIPGVAPARDAGALPRPRHRHGGVLRLRVLRGHVGIDQRDHRLRRDARVDRGAIQDPHALPGNAALQADGGVDHREGLGAVRRLHADVQPREPDAGRTAIPARQRVHAFLRAAVVPRELPAHLDAARARALSTRSMSASNAGTAREVRRDGALVDMLTTHCGDSRMPPS